MRHIEVLISTSTHTTPIGLFFGHTIGFIREVGKKRSGARKKGEKPCATIEVLLLKSKHRTTGKILFGQKYVSFLK